jgi:hypothetical protein
MKYSLRKSFNARRRKEIPSDDPIYPRIDANGCSNSNSNLVNPVKSKSSRRCSSSDKNKSKVFEPRYDVPSNDDDDDDDEPFSSSENTRTRPFDRLTYQIRKSFRNTLTRHESPNSNLRLISNKNDENSQKIPILPPTISTGLTSPLPISVENDHTKTLVKRKKTSLPIEINPEQSQNFNRSFRTRFSFLRKKRPDNQPDENPTTNQKLTLTQRLNSLRRSFHIGNRNSSNKGKRYLLSNNE